MFNHDIMHNGKYHTFTHTHTQREGYHKLSNIINIVNSNQAEYDYFSEVSSDTDEMHFFVLNLFS